MSSAHPGGCPCCNNPWSQAGVGFCGVCPPAPPAASAPVPSNGGIDPDNFDYSVSAKHDFYMHCNGGWMAKNPIPLEYSSWNTFMELRDRNLDRLKAIVDDLHSALGPLPDDQQKLADFYRSMMDEECINAAGMAPLAPVLDWCRRAADGAALEEVVGTLHSKFGVNVLFSLYASPDKKNSKWTIGSLSQSGLGLPDRDYYFDADKREKLSKYRGYVESLFRMLGANGLPEYSSTGACTAAARDVLAIETAIAASHMTRTERRDAEKTYNKMTVETLSTLCKNQTLEWRHYLSRGVGSLDFSWDSYFNIIGKPTAALGEINVAAIDAVKRAVLILGSECYTQPSASASSLCPLANYFIFHAALSYSAHLPTEFGTAHFRFFEQELKGTAEQSPRWKRTLQQLEHYMGDSFGKLYTSLHFSEDAKNKALRIVELVRDAFKKRLFSVEWMCEATREEALRKMENFRVKVGYPDKFINYDGLVIFPHDPVDSRHVDNVINARTFSVALELSRINCATDRDLWFMTPQTVNAYYHPSLNEIVFPAAILQHPFFDPNNDEAVNFGSLGSVVGHEMTHGFDDQGRKYDSSGNMRDWWAGADGTEYERRADVMIQQAESVEVFGVKLKGKLTCGENIADLGGVKLSLAALKTVLSSDELCEKKNGLTNLQRFFVSWAQAWRQNIKQERALQLVTLDPHGPNDFRCNGTLSNVQDFLDSFGISAGDEMYKEPAERVDIW